MSRRAAAALALALALAAAAPAAALPPVGSPGPSVTIRTHDDLTLTADDLSDGVTVLVFASAYCPHCRAKIPKVAEAIARCRTVYPVTVIFDGLSGDVQADLDFFSQVRQGDNWHFVAEDAMLARQFEVVAVPAVVVVSPGWIISKGFVGEIPATEMCRAMGGSQSGALTFLVASTEADVRAAEAVIEEDAPLVVDEYPDSGSFLVVGGPLAHTPGRIAAGWMDLYFHRAAGGGIVMEIPALSETLTVAGSDWGRRDYAAVGFRVGGATLEFAAMGCTRYGTEAAVLWWRANVASMRPGWVYVLEWEDSNGDGEVQLEEVSAIGDYPLPP